MRYFTSKDSITETSFNEKDQTKTTSQMQQSKSVDGTKSLKFSNSLSVPGQSEITALKKKRAKLVRSTHAAPQSESEEGKDSCLINSKTPSDIDCVSNKHRRKNEVRCSSNAHPLSLPVFKITVNEDCDVDVDKVNEIIISDTAKRKSVDVSSCHRKLHKCASFAIDRTKVEVKSVKAPSNSVDAAMLNIKTSRSLSTSSRPPSLCIKSRRSSSNSSKTCSFGSKSYGSSNASCDEPHHFRHHRHSCPHQASSFSPESEESGICSGKPDISKQNSTQSCYDDDQYSFSDGDYRRCSCDSARQCSCDTGSICDSVSSHASSMHMTYTSIDQPDALSYNKHMLYPGYIKRQGSDSIGSYSFDGEFNEPEEKVKNKEAKKPKSFKRSSSIWSRGSSFSFSFYRKHSRESDEVSREPFSPTRHYSAYSVGESINRLTLTQTLAFPTLVPGYIESHKRHDPHLEMNIKLNRFAKIITCVILTLVMVLLFAIFYRLIQQL